MHAPGHRYTVPSLQNPTVDRFFLGSPVVHPGSTFCLCPSRVFADFRAAFRKKALCKRNVQGKGEASIPSPSDNSSFLVPAPILCHMKGRFHQQSLDLGLTFPNTSLPPPNPVASTSCPDGAGEHLDFKMTQGCSGCLSAFQDRKGARRPSSQVAFSP